MKGVRVSLLVATGDGCSGWLDGWVTASVQSTVAGWLFPTWRLAAAVAEVGAAFIFFLIARLAEAVNGLIGNISSFRGVVYSSRGY